MKKETWLIVANSSIARIFKVHRKEALVEIETLVHPESRLHNRDLVSDRPGRTSDSVGFSRHAIEPTVDPQHQECIEFAREIARYLEKGRTQGIFDKLYIAAGPSQLGLLRQTIHAQTLNLVAGEVNKDMTHMKPEEIINHLPFIL
jgi:protein required for attachment to host cells